MARWHACIALFALLAVAQCLAGPSPSLRRAAFDSDPGWDGRNNRSRALGLREIRQDFGYSPTAHAGGAPGEIGGYITGAAETAYYAKPIPARTFADPLFAEGRLNYSSGRFNALLGFFNIDTLNEWRTPNTIALRLHGRGDRVYAYVEYATARWRAGGDSPGGFSVLTDPETGRRQLRGFPRDTSLRWTLRYDPDGNDGGGAVTVTLGDETAVCNLDSGHKADGAAFTHFGLLTVMKHSDDGGELWLDDLSVLGEEEPCDHDPAWDALGNRRTYLSDNVRPRFDFGFSPTHFAGGAAPGELGGRVYRGDNRHPERLAAYGDPIGPLTLDQPLTAGGRVALRRGVSDSTSLIGFYHSSDSLQVSDTQASGVPRNFMGIAVEGPSSDGFLFRPIYRISEDGARVADREGAPPIYPDGSAHTWRLEYAPDAAGGTGRLTAWLDEQKIAVDLHRGARAQGGSFDRFGIVTTWIDGNGQEIYFDDLFYSH
jgi:hypothetical protein